MNLEKSGIKKDFWKSLKEYYDDAGVLKAKVNEFSDGVTDDFNPDELNTFTRRKFLALLSASAAVAATACSDYRDKGEIIPYTHRPEGVTPGKPNYYASMVNGKSILVKVREGRPVAIEGNPEHPVYKGKVDAQTPAAILNLYDPERMQGPEKLKRKIDWKRADAEIIALLKQAVSENKEIALITGRITSPTGKKVIEDFRTKYPTARWYSYEQVSDENKRIAWQKLYGTRNVPSVQIDKANIILSIDSDFLGREGNIIEQTRLFASRRDIMKNDNFNRLFTVEGAMSLTGMNSDYRIRLRPDYQLEFVLSLLNEIVVKKGISRISLDTNSINLLGRYNLNSFISKHGLDVVKINYLLNDLVRYQGNAIVLAGESSPVELHIVVNLLNEVLSNTQLYNYKSVFNVLHTLNTNEELLDLTAKMKSGQVAVAVNFGVDPVFHLPAGFEFEAAYEKVPATISIIESENDTSGKSTFSLASSHELESWGDNHSRSDVYELQQPVIAPIFNSRQKENILLTWINGSAEAYSEEAYHIYLQENFKSDVYQNQNVAADFKSYWYNVLHDGFITIENNPDHPELIDENHLADISIMPSSDQFLVQLQKSYFIGDGKFANNGWLQEVPHPVSKIAWDNYAAISPATASELGVENFDLINVSVNGVTLELPVMIQPGSAEKLVTIELGYGRTVIGDVGKGAGFNASILIGSSGELCSVAEVSKSSGSYKLASTQEHHSLDDQSVKDFHKLRAIIQDGTLEEYRKNPNFLHEDEHKLIGITREHKYEGVKWGMSIDLNKCISCATCVTSCNVENNIPVVGKEQVVKGREMHWIRLDRYYSGTPEEPEASNQPMLCQHCDNAPCENVCPVNATNHSPDGLNQMAYNRCVGTRYCANNCPYKVRRFNFFNFRDHFADAYYNNNLTALVNNPEVTVRSRGVMEKCTFCVQRIMEAREGSIREGRDLKGSDVKTACQSACPADAIVFGDTNDKESEISKHREHELGYHVLEELYIKPNVTYLAKLRNTHPEEA
jgi:molybdopterin-containing oxidoreductase family iron-sulfur binding subunit